MKKIQLVVLMAAVLLVGVGIFVWRKTKSEVVVPSTNSSQSEKDSLAIKAGKQLSNNSCNGEGVAQKLSHSPMDKTDFAFVIPYGLMVGGHVTPIDHQYFAPADYKSPVNAYPVFAMGDATITGIQTRNNSQLNSTEYRLIFTQTCTFLYYFDLVTGLEPGIKEGVKVTAGQLIGHIGGRTLDYAVWDTTKPLGGFVNPTSYQGEAWKIYVADPLDYYTDELKTFILSRYVRTAEPISGKIDNDIDGKLIGNWFLEGSGGYAGPGGGQDGYWSGHLAIAPDLYDPTHYIVSIGALYKVVGRDNEMQHMIVDSTINPKTVGLESGLVKYDLSGWIYTKADGSSWDQMKIATGIRAKANQSQRFGCGVFQLAETRKIQFELFRDKDCAVVTAFDSDVKTYVR